VHCDSLVTIQKDKPHTCYSKKDHSEDAVKPELTHKNAISEKR
jgi:hypothetical protein